MRIRKNIATTSVFWGLLSVVTLTTTTTLVLARETDTDRQNVHPEQQQQLRTSALDNANDLIEKGNAFSENNQYKQALTAYNQAVRLLPESPTAYFLRGLLFHKMHRYEDAIADFTRTTDAKFESHPAPYLNRALAYIALHKERQNSSGTLVSLFKFRSTTNNLISLALADLNRAVELAPNEPLSYDSRGNLYALELKQYKQAIKDYDRALELKPEYAATYFNRGNAYQKLGNHTNAIADLKRSVQLAEQNNDALAVSKAYDKLHSLGS